MANPLKGPVLIVGVGPGLGIALVQTFAEAGYPVGMIARSSDKLDGYKNNLAGLDAVIETFTADAADPISLRAGLVTAIRTMGAPGALIYNAAVIRDDGPLDGDDEAWASALAIDVTGAKIAAETVAPHFVDGHGSLLFTGGALGINPSAQQTSLSVGKAALRIYALALHEHLAGRDVLVGTVTVGGEIGGPDPELEPRALASHYLVLHESQDRDDGPEIAVG